MDLKIGRNVYQITKEDRFMDNGCCVQLITQSKERSSWGHMPNPVLSKKAVKELSKVGQVEHDNSRYTTEVRIFSLDI